MAMFDKTTQIADIIIHVDEDVNRKEERSILGVLKDISGVFPPQFNTPHLIVVNYNPDQTNSMDLLSAVRSKGYHAQLLGM